MSQEEEAAAEQWYDSKVQVLERLLGKQHEIVSHAIVPYAMGGALDLYYFEQSPLGGTAIATLELSESADSGPSNQLFKSYEMAMFTKVKLNLDEAYDPSTTFGKAHDRINTILNVLGPYSTEEELNRHDTAEFPEDFEEIGGSCIVFDALGAEAGRCDFGLMVPIEIFRSEMEYARVEGGAKLIEKLKAAGHYPFSDLDRQPVV